MREGTSVTPTTTRVGRALLALVTAVALLATGFTAGPASAASNDTRTTTPAAVVADKSGGTAAAMTIAPMGAPSPMRTSLVGQPAAGYNLVAGKNHRIGPRYFTGLFRDGKICTGYDQCMGNGSSRLLDINKLPNIKGVNGRAAAIVLAQWSDLTGLSVRAARVQATAVRTAVFQLQGSAKWRADEPGYNAQLDKLGVGNDVRRQVTSMKAAALAAARTEAPFTVTKTVTPASAGNISTITVKVAAGSAPLPNTPVALTGLVNATAQGATFARTNARGTVTFRIMVRVGTPSGKISARVPSEQINGNLPYGGCQQLYWAKWNMKTITFTFHKTTGSSVIAKCGPKCTGINIPVFVTVNAGASRTQCTISHNGVVEVRLDIAPRQKGTGQFNNGVDMGRVATSCQYLIDGRWTRFETIKTYVIDCPPWAKAIVTVGCDCDSATIPVTAEFAAAPSAARRYTVTLTGSDGQVKSAELGAVKVPLSLDVPSGTTVTVSFTVDGEAHTLRTLVVS